MLSKEASGTIFYKVLGIMQSGINPGPSHKAKAPPLSHCCSVHNCKYIGSKKLRIFTFGIFNDVSGHFRCGNPLSGHPSLTQARHRAHLTACCEDLDEFLANQPPQDIVLASECLRRALREIGKLTGRITSEDILDVIFRDFCIGK